MSGVRWDELFRDLEAQLAAADAAELDAEVADRTRRESALLSLLDRARGACGTRVGVRVLGGETVDGLLAEVGPQWLLLADDAGRDVLVPAGAVLTVTGLAVWTGGPGAGGQVSARLGLGSALRALAQDRAPVTVLLIDGSAVTGTIDRVGADFVEITDREAGSRDQRRPQVRTVPTAALAVVRAGG
jgi:hypothetical protein